MISSGEGLDEQCLSMSSYPMDLAIAFFVLYLEQQINKPGDRSLDLIKRCYLRDDTL